MQDGRIVRSVPLDSPPQDVTIKTELGTNVIRAGGGGIEIISADCPEGSCMNSGRLTRPGEGAVCLPHKLSVRVRAAGGTAGKNGVDGGTW